MENLSLYQTIMLSAALVAVYVRFNIAVSKQEVELSVMKEQMKEMKKEHHTQMESIKESIDALLRSVKHIELTLAKKQIT
jgi:uncharacterized membrane protein (DUF106 family)